MKPIARKDSIESWGRDSPDLHGEPRSSRFVGWEMSRARKPVWLGNHSGNGLSVCDQGGEGFLIHLQHRRIQDP